LTEGDLDPFLIPPGSAEARERGCICDPGQESPYRVEKMCPLHGLAELKAALETPPDPPGR
jgi:hypothetical protein